jgi:hypothetical protein
LIKGQGRIRYRVNAAVPVRRDRLYILIHAMIDSNEPSTEQKKQELHVARLKHVIHQHRPSTQE